jgi:hypothetical protein
MAVLVSLRLLFSFHALDALHSIETPMLMRTTAANELYTRLSAFHGRGCEDISASDQELRM